VTTKVVTTHPNLFKVTYADPAGSFGGWFLHSVNDAPSTQFSEGTWTSNADYSVPLTSSIKARLSRMFGDAAVTYTLEIVEEVTPAVIDTDF
jgi:hypothetical protein